MEGILTRCKWNWIYY